MTLYLSGDCVAGFIYDGVYFLDDVKVSFIVGVPDTCPTPGDVGQLTSGQCGANTITKIKRIHATTVVIHSIPCKQNMRSSHLSRKHVAPEQAGQ